MSINQHQFEQLTEMGISLWQSKSIDVSTAEESTSESDSISFEVIDLKVLAKQQIFNDILLSIGLSIGEVSLQGDHLDLGFFNWFFVSDRSVQKDTTSDSNLADNKGSIRWSDQQIFTPSISQISKFPELKKQLWQLLSTKVQ